MHFDDLVAKGLPSWLPGETLFSLASRYHRLAGHPAPKHTARILFGSGQSGYQHDFPSGIDHFTEVTGAAYGTALEVIQERTLLPFYVALRDRQTETDAISILRSPLLGPLKYRLGLTASGFRSHHPLKICHYCLDHDAALYGTGYWHIEHQVPGVTTCLHHHALLGVSDVKTSGVLRFGYLLPSDKYQDCFPDRLDVSERLCQVSRIAMGLWCGDNPASRNLTLLQQCCHSVLLKAGEITRKGFVRRRSVGAAYSRFLQPLHNLAEFQGLPKDIDACGREVSRLVGSQRNSLHPLRYVCLIAWLFGDWRSVSIVEAKNQAAERTQDPDRVKREAFHAAVEERQLSASQASREVGVDVATGIGWAREAGIIVGRRAKWITDKTLRSIVVDLERGDDKQEIASKHGISLVSVSRVLRSTPGLSNTWITSKRRHRRDLERGHWKGLVSTHGHLGLKVLRTISPRTYAWLYKHDSAWFAAARESVDQIVVKPKPTVDWLQRDQALAVEIETASARLANRNPSKKITFGVLCQEITGLKPRLSQTDRLPLTRIALLRAVTRSRRVEKGDSLPIT